MKRIIALLLAILMIACVLPAVAEEGLKLSDEKITLKVWFPIAQENLGQMADLNEADVYKWMEEQTNVHIEWINAPSGSEKEAFNLLFGADSLPDIVFCQDGKFMYADGAEASVDDGYFLRLNELIDQYAPNYAALRASSTRIANDTATDSGLIWSFYFIYAAGGKGCNFGSLIRQDFLDKVGMEVPTTFDELHEVLVAFKDQLGVPYPMYLNKYGTTWKDEFMVGFGTCQDFFQVDGQVKYGPMEDGYGEYLATMKKWFEEGLIYTDFAIGNEEEPVDDLTLNDKLGVWAGYATHSGDKYHIKRGATNPDFNLVGMPFPVVNKGDETLIRMMDTIVNTYSWAISTDCKYPEIAVKWLDTFYNPEYFDNFNYGLREGESYVVDENGQKHWGSLIMNNPEGLTVNQGRVKYTMLNPFYEIYTRVMGSWSESQKAAQQLWLKGKQDWCISSKLSPSADENREMNTVLTDIRTFVREETVKIIMGTSTYDFEGFRNQIKSMGIDKAIAVEQIVLDRYNAR